MPNFVVIASLPKQLFASGTLGDREEVFTRLSSGQACITRGYRNHSCTSQFFANNAVAVSAVVRLRPTAYSRSPSPSPHGRTRMIVFPGRRPVGLKAVTASSRVETVP